MSTGTRRLSCPKCNKIFYNRSKLLNHQIEVHKLKIKYKACHECDYKSVDLSNFRRHISIHSGQKAHPCNYCTSRFDTSTNLRFHILRSHGEERPYQCDECGFKFTNIKDLKSHSRVHNAVKSNECDQCRSRFTHRSSLKRHLKVHSGETTCSCWICGARFVNDYALKYHMTSHDVHES